MSTVAEIEDAVQRLSLQDKLRLLDSIGKTVAREQALRSPVPAEQNAAHSVLDIPLASVGAVLNPHFDRSDLLEDMKKERL
jgi:hypothetical protein